MSSMWRELSSLEYSVSHSTQGAPYTHARQNLHVGCTNTQWTSSIFSTVPQGPGEDPARMIDITQPQQNLLQAAGIEPGSLNHRSQPLTIGPFPTPFCA